MKKFYAAGPVLAVGLVMASQARADTLPTPADGWSSGVVVTSQNRSADYGQTGFLPNGTLTVQAYPQPPHCTPGWTLVDVGVATGGTIHKCAAVGDLRDPE